MSNCCRQKEACESREMARAGVGGCCMSDQVHTGVVALHHPSEWVHPGAADAAL
jgi:hypothetical protein